MDVERLLATDETFAEVADLLFGSGGDDLIRHVIAKANPDGADLMSAAERRKKAERTQAKIGLASNVVGLAAGAAGLHEASRNPALKAKKGSTISPKAFKVSGKTKALAAGAVGLQGLNLAGDAIANRVLARSAKKEPDVKGGAPTAARAGLKKIDEVKLKKSAGRLVPISKADAEMTWEVEFSKFDEDKHLVFGWASVVKKNGEDVVDLQGDYIHIDDVEKSAYDYVLTSRKGGHQHRRDGDAPVHVSDMVESFVVTPEKIEKMGLPEDTPLGWWTGFKVHDEDTWQRVKKGELTGFSVHGRGKRTVMDS